MGRGRNRRRVDRESVAGGAPGRRRRLALALAGVALLAGAGAGAVRGWAALRSAESLRIRAIRFQGLSHATADELLALSPVRPGDHVIFADLRAMRAALERHPWVRALSVRRSWPPSLVVTVRERTAVALVDLGGLYLVDDEGNVYVSDTVFGNVQVFNSDGELLLAIGERSLEDGPGKFLLPAGVAVDETGRLYVVDQFFHKVEVIRRLTDEEGMRIVRANR